MKDKLNQWLAFIDDTDGRLVKMAEENNKTLKQARVEMNYLTGDAAVRRMAELREKWEMDRISAIEYAQKKEKIKIAKNMLSKNMDISIIAEMTGLTENEINELK